MTVLGQIETAKVAAPAAGTALVRRTPPRRGRSPLVAAILAERMAFVHGVVISAYLGVTVVAGSIFFEQVNDRVLPHKTTTTLAILFATLVVLLLIGAYLNKQRDHVLERIAIRVDHKLRPILFEAAIRSRFDTRCENASSALEDLDKVRMVLAGRGLSALYDMVPVPAYIAVCFAMHVWLGLFVSVMLALIVVVAFVTVLLRVRGEAGVLALQQSKTTNLVNTFVNIEAIQALGMRKAFRERWIADHRRALIAAAAAEDRIGPLDTTMNFLIAAASGLTMAVGAYVGLRGEISPGNVIGCMLLSAKLVQPVGLLVTEWGFFVRAYDSFGRLQALFRDLEDGKRETRDLPRPTGKLDVEDLAMAAPRSNRFIIAKVDFSLPAGSALGVIGPSGAGKSTLVRALVGIWPPAHGSVRLDGAELQHWDADRLGAHLGYLPQNVELLSGTIAENIARFGTVDDDAVLEAAKLAGVHDVIQSLPQGYNTHVGEGGNALSGGQRQRVGLARAIYGNPALIVLDEPNSNLDAIGENALAEAIRAMKERGTTCILITHKANILKMVDFVLVLKDGTMSAFGPRDTVLSPVGLPSIPAPTHTTPVAQRRETEGDAA